MFSIAVVKLKDGDIFCVDYEHEEMPEKEAIECMRDDLEDAFGTKLDDVRFHYGHRSH